VDVVNKLFAPAIDDATVAVDICDIPIANPLFAYDDVDANDALVAVVANDALTACNTYDAVCAVVTNDAVLANDADTAFKTYEAVATDIDDV
jgi:hypothetical protein